MRLPLEFKKSGFPFSFILCSMLSDVLAPCHLLQVRRSVVQGIAITMMNNVAARQSSIGSFVDNNRVHLPDIRLSDLHEGSFFAVLVNSDCDASNRKHIDRALTFLEFCSTRYVCTFRNSNERFYMRKPLGTRSMDFVSNCRRSKAASRTILCSPQLGRLEVEYFSAIFTLFFHSSKYITGLLTVTYQQESV
jgi:hypothetical protein